jgi:energy-converting hydrogenase Eha subunit C
MAHLVDRHFFQRANKILMLGLLWSGLVASMIGALAYDVALWLGR